MNETMKERWERLSADPATFETCIEHLMMGGCLSTLTDLWRVTYANIMSLMYSTPDRKQRYEDALQARSDFVLAKLLNEINRIAFTDSRKLFKDDHSLKPINEWPDDIAAAVSSIEVSEEFDYEDRKKVLVGHLKKVKLYDKLKAIEMLGRDLGRFVQKHEVSGKVTLEDLVTGSQQEDKAI